MKLGKILGETIEKRGYTQSRLAREAGVNPKSLSDWIDDRTPRDLDAVRRVARVLGVSVSFLLFGEDDSVRDEAANAHGEGTIHAFDPSGTFEITIRRVQRPRPR